MQQFESYKDFLQSTYRHWVPTHKESHNEEPSEEILSRPATFFAYTDYGGTFYDKVACAFLWEHAPGEYLLWQPTVYDGMNLLYLGPAEGWGPELRFPEIGNDFESFYYDAESTAEFDHFRFMAEDMFGHRKRLVEFAHQTLVSNLSGHYSLGPDGQLNVGYERLKTEVAAALKRRHKK